MSSYPIEIPTRAGRFGRLATIDLIDGKTTIVQRAIRRSGLRGVQPWTVAGTLALCELSGPDAVLYDVGANGGLHAWMAKSLVPRTTVVAFEPAPTSARTAAEIAERNRLDITVEQVAVSDRPGTAVLYLSSKSDASNSLTEGFREAKGTVEVPTVPLDRYIEGPVAPPTVLKIDVELHELEVLVGARNLLRDHRPAVIIEVLADQPAHESAIRGFLEQYGYTGQPLEPLHEPEDPDKLRDWVFAVGGLPRRFARRHRRWQAALARCGPPAPGPRTR